MEYAHPETADNFTLRTQFYLSHFDPNAVSADAYCKIWALRNGMLKQPLGTDDTQTLQLFVDPWKGTGESKRPGICELLAPARIFSYQLTLLVASPSFLANHTYSAVVDVFPPELDCEPAILSADFDKVLIQVNATDCYVSLEGMLNLNPGLDRLLDDIGPLQQFPDDWPTDSFSFVEAMVVSRERIWWRRNKRCSQFRDIDFTASLCTPRYALSPGKVEFQFRQ